MQNGVENKCYLPSGMTMVQVGAGFGFTRFRVAISKSIILLYLQSKQIKSG